MTPEHIAKLEQQVRQEHALLSAYPNAKKAVAWVELMLCVPIRDEPGESSWDMMVTAKIPPGEIVAMVRQCIHEEQEDGKHHGERYLAVVRQAHTETFHPEFLSYIAGKLGMM
jgi:hypothetical protein